ncbi:hypothetical protein APSETT445_008968 [Aspergillus pseudonomiae]
MFGAASAIRGIATTGIQCSIKLITVAGLVKSAQDEITDIAKDVLLNASILQQLDQLAKNRIPHEQTPLCPNDNDEKLRIPDSVTRGDAQRSTETQHGVFNAAGLAVVLKLATECNDIFSRLNEALQETSKALSANTDGQTRIKATQAGMVHWPLTKPQIDGMQARLRDAKGTLMLMLQVAMLRYSETPMEGPPISPANEPLVTQLSVYLASPKLQIAYGKVHVEYQTRLLRISRTEIDSQIQQWRDSSNRTVLDQLHSLTANEQQALDAINCGHNSKGLLAAGTLEWIQFGEYLPVNGVEHIMARSITIIISSKDQSSTEKEKPEPIREEEDARYGKESNTWVKEDPGYMIIKQWIPEDLQEELFAHTQNLRNGRFIERKASTSTKLKVDDRERDRRFGSRFLSRLKRGLEVAGLYRLYRRRIEEEDSQSDTSTSPERVEGEANFDSISHIARDDSRISVLDSRVFEEHRSSFPQTQNGVGNCGSIKDHESSAVPLEFLLNDGDKVGQEDVEGIVGDLLYKYTAA